ncbi:MAG: hypothetical protein KDB07_09580, partial [Planctomycetes bacterium]|nr:hypothetical protein [Planctomycetota bacterium]
MPITNAAEAEQEYFEALNLACDFTRKVVEHHRKKLKEDDKTPPAAARMWVNVMAEVHRLRADYVRSRPRPDSTIPDDPRFAEIGKALAIGDSWGAAQRVMKLFYDPPPILKTYWFKVFADKRKQSLKPPLAERASLVTSDSGVKRIEPEPELYVRYPMPDDGTPVPDEI